MAKGTKTGRMVALIRGINVGTAKRVSMEELQALVESLGFRDVQTLLNSGNVVFSASHTEPGAAAAKIEEGLVARIGVSARVIVLTAAELDAAVRENPLLDIADNHSRLLVSFLANPADRSRLASLANQAWTPDTLAIGARVAYMWCPEGALASRLSQAVGRVLGDAVTARNWATVTKLHALL